MKKVEVPILAIHSAVALIGMSLLVMGLSYVQVESKAAYFGGAVGATAIYVFHEYSQSKKKKKSMDFLPWFIPSMCAFIVAIAAVYL